MKAKFLINLDSEEEGFLTIGCAGGIDTVATRKLTLADPGAGKKAFRLKIFGLKGGHSGIDINAGRGNAIRLLAQVLGALLPRFAFELASIKGGNKRNAIPREASATVLLEAGRESEMKAELAKLEATWKAALGAFDPGLAMTLEPTTPDKVMSAEDTRAVVGLLVSVPHGVEAMSPDIPNLVQTSTNLGVVDTKEGKVEAVMLTRSSIDTSKAALAERIGLIATLAGFEARLEGAYPGWKPEPGSSIVKLIDGVQQELFGKPMKVVAIHAGLECGLIGEKYPAMEMASIGPDMWDVHTPDEHVSIPSVGRFWPLLKTVLERI